MLDRGWNRIAHATPSEQYEQENEKEIYMQDPQTLNNTIGRLRPQDPQRPRRTSLVQRLGTLAAAVLLVALVGSMAIVFYAVRHTNGGPASPHPTPTLSSTPKTPPLPLKGISLGISVPPPPIPGLPPPTNPPLTPTTSF